MFVIGSVSHLLESCQQPLRTDQMRHTLRCLCQLHEGWRESVVIDTARAVEFDSKLHVVAVHTSTTTTMGHVNTILPYMVVTLNRGDETQTHRGVNYT